MRNDEFALLLRTADQPQSPPGGFVEDLWADLELALIEESLMPPTEVRAAMPDVRDDALDKPRARGPAVALVAAAIVLVTGVLNVFLTSDPSDVLPPPTSAEPGAAVEGAEAQLSSHAITMIKESCFSGDKVPTVEGMTPQTINHASGQLRILLHILGEAAEPGDLDHTLQSAIRYLGIAEEAYVGFDPDTARAERFLGHARDSLQSLERRLGVDDCLVDAN